ncbi:DUF3857 domain-containing protein [candidate division WOR-3 bacterium]|uniref:DUF3857 domain-containing protein n=1 Tax=candidate division WOR-3 bacterium TaxID=2052148 RepID=A0A9D5QD71_UNCW3|nr:DUF3857 domain-containing protein [candidate division WOR-3 bacterium]MBD3364751.1 DUF3857 domain-containing protein [candidate division WOR-3 bacterium]
MKRYIVCFLVIAVVCFGVKVELHNGEEIICKEVKFSGNYLISTRDSVDRSNIKTIIFETEASSKAVNKNVNDSDVQNLLKTAREAEKNYPDAKGVNLSYDLVHILNDDGSRGYTYRFAFLILSELRKDVATFRARFEEGENEIKVHYGRVIKPSGRVIELDHSQIRIESPPREDIVFFGKEKWVTFTLPEVEVGDIIEYSSENIFFNPWNRGIFKSGLLLADEDPSVSLKFTIDVPEDEYIKWKNYNFPDGVDYGPQIDTLDGRKTYMWLAENVKPYVKEPNAPPTGDFAPKVAVTNQEDWEAIFDWYRDFQTERIKVTPRIQALSDSLTKEAETEAEKISSIYHWTQQNIRYISIKGAAGSGVSGHPAEFTLERGFGDCTDKSILFTTLLTASGIDAAPVYVGTNRSVAMLDPEVPGYYGNHCITEVFLADTNLYLDATGSSSGGYSRYPSFSATDHGVYAVNALKRKVELVPVPLPEAQTRHYNLDVEIDKEGTLFVKYKSEYEGTYETGLRYYWNYYTREEDRRLTFEKMIKRESPNAELIDYKLVNVGEIDKQLSLEITYRIPEYVKFTGPVAIINLPEVGRRLVFDEVSLEKRNLPLMYYSSDGIQHHINLTLPEDWNIDFLPPEINLSTDEVSYQASYVQESENNIRFEDRFERSYRIIEPARYQDYRNTLKRITGYHEKPVLVQVN